MVMGELMYCDLTQSPINTVVLKLLIAILIFFWNIDDLFICNAHIALKSSKTYQQLHPAQQVNVAKAQGYLFANISVTMITMLINLLAAITILRKERTSVHLLIVNDCVVNVLSSLLTRASQSDPRSESCNPFFIRPKSDHFLLLSVTN